jgi:hypothetical protein
METIIWCMVKLDPLRFQPPGQLFSFLPAVPGHGMEVKMGRHGQRLGPIIWPQQVVLMLLIQYGQVLN